MVESTDSLKYSHLSQRRNLWATVDAVEVPSSSGPHKALEGGIKPLKSFPSKRHVPKEREELWVVINQTEEMVLKRLHHDIGNQLLEKKSWNGV